MSIDDLEFTVFSQFKLDIFVKTSQLNLFFVQIIQSRGEKTHVYYTEFLE